MPHCPDFTQPQLVLAPMEGLTDPLMRQVLTGMGCYDWTVSEFIRVTQHLLPAHVFYKYVPELRYTGELQGKTCHGTPVHVQLLGSDATLLAENAQYACELGALAIDLNFGCPAKTVNSHRGGSVLLTEPETVFAIIDAVRRAVPSDTPVSAKIRLGYEDTTQLADIFAAVVDAHASWLTIHARTKTQGYKPPAYWNMIAPLTHEDSHTLPIIANGEIWTLEHALACREQANTQHLMLGRGAVTRPDLVNQIKAHDAGINYVPWGWQQLLELQWKFLQGTAKTDTMLVGRYKQWLGMLMQGYPEAQALWQQVKREKDLDKIIALLIV